jgi:hypothetical protein
MLSINSQFYNVTTLAESTASQVRLNLSSFSPAPGMVLQLFWWLNSLPDGLDVTVASLQGAAIAATGRMTLRANNLRPRLIASSWVPVGATVPSQTGERSFSFYSPANRTVQITTYLYDAPSQLSSTIPNGDPALVLITTTCSASGLLYTCTGTFPESLANGNETAVVAVRLTFPDVDLGTSPITPVAQSSSAASAGRRDLSFNYCSQCSCDLNHWPLLQTHVRQQPVDRIPRSRQRCSGQLCCVFRVINSQDVLDTHSFTI